MAILTCREIGEGRSGSQEYRDGRFSERSTRVFEVTTNDSGHDDQYVLGNAHTASPDPAPLVGTTHPSDSDLICRSRSARGGSRGEEKFWILTLEYDNNVSSNSSDTSTNPMDRRVRWRMEFNNASRAVTHDIQGNPIQTKAGAAFDPPLEDEDGTPVVIAVRNQDASELNSIMATASDYRGAVNSDEWHGLEAGSVRCRNIGMGEIQFETGYEYYSVVYEFEVRSREDLLQNLQASQVENFSTVEGWDRLVLHQGFKAKLPDGTIGNLEGSKPWKLDANGAVFADQNEFYYRSFKTRKRRPFSGLNL